MFTLMLVRTLTTSHGSSDDLRRAARINLHRLTVIVLLLIGTSVAQPSTANAANDIPSSKWTDRTNLGLHGPVHCSLITTEKIAPEPRKASDELISVNPGTPWLCFNQGGWIVESGSVEAGKPVNVVKEERGPNGERLRNTLGQRDVKRREGDVQIEETWNNDRLEVRRKTWVDAQDRPVRMEMQLGDNGYEVVHTTTYDGSAETTDMQEFSKGKLVVHNRITVDSESGLIDKMRFEPEGSMIAQIRSVKDQLIHAWHIPGIKDMDNPFGAPWVEAFKQTVWFSFARNGDALKNVQHHPGRYGNVEPDDSEVMDKRGVTLERAEFKYERDAHGNWINRTVLIRDPRTGAMIEVMRNHRELTYY